MMKIGYHNYMDTLKMHVGEVVTKNVLVFIIINKPAKLTLTPEQRHPFIDPPLASTIKLTRKSCFVKVKASIAAVASSAHRPPFWPLPPRPFWPPSSSSTSSSSCFVSSSSSSKWRPSSTICK